MGGTLSGGEQQMLAIGRALMTNPRLLILDEATEGLAPLIRDEIWNCLSLLKAKGQSVLVIDKNIENLTRIADRHYIIERGRAVWSGTSDELIAAAGTAASVFGDLNPDAELDFRQRPCLVSAADGIMMTRSIAKS